MPSVSSPEESTLNEMGHYELQPDDSDISADTYTAALYGYYLHEDDGAPVAADDLEII